MSPPNIVSGTDVLGTIKYLLKNVHTSHQQWRFPQEQIHYFVIYIILIKHIINFLKHVYLFNFSLFSTALFCFLDVLPAPGKSFMQ